ncbi:uncharacterized protein YhaN [Paenibacillus sp. DS2015]|uniref:AAA family ATPase n=1 Tax=Paenibacillus sp. DS2015 TaxID=3373917 RepID=UPI003D1F590B
MRIERLQIHGFGRMKEQDLTTYAPITVLFGPNEAGKSTILQFVRAMLFGIPSRSYPTERYEPLSGGVHGGVLTASDGDHCKWTISRFTTPVDGGGTQANRGEKVSITRTDPDGSVQQLTQQDMERMLLGGMSREMFTQLFAISLTELQEIRTLQSEEMSSYLFHAGIGGGSEIVRAERKLMQDMEKLYKPKGRVQESAKVLQSMEKLEKQIAESRSALQQYNENAIALEQIEERIVAQELVRHQPINQLQLLRKAEGIRPMWIDWTEAEAERSKLPRVVSFPEEGIYRWQSLSTEHDALKVSQLQLTRVREELIEKLMGLQGNNQLEEQGLDIERLSSRVESYEAKSRELHETKAEAKALDERVTYLIRQMNPKWTSVELESFSGAIGERESVRRYATGFAGYDRRMESLGLELQQVQRRRDVADAEYRNARNAYKEQMDIGRSQFTMMIKYNRHEVTGRWNELQTEVERWRENHLLQLVSQGHEESEITVQLRIQQLFTQLLWGSGVLTVLVPIILWMDGSTVGAMTVAALLLVVDIFFMVKRLTKKKGSPRSGRTGKYISTSGTTAEEQRIVKLMQELVTQPWSAASTDASVKQSFNARELEIGIRELRQVMEMWQLWHRKMDELLGEQKICHERVESLSLELTRVEERMSKEEQIFEQLQLQWESWLRDRSLAEHLSPEAVLDMFGLAERGMELLSQLDKVRRKEAQLEQDCLEFETDCTRLLPEGADHLTLSPIAWVELKKQEWLEQQEMMRGRDKLQSKLEPIEEQCAQVVDELHRVSSLMMNLLKISESDNGEDYLRRGAIHQRMDELTRSMLQWEIVMFSGMDDERRAEVITLLKSMDSVQLEQACRHGEALVNEAESSWNELQQRRGRLLQERDRLEQLCLHDTILQQLEEQKTTLKNITIEYAVMSICSELILRTRHIYEEEKQPQVLKLASTYFERLTGGKYTRIVMKMGEKELLAEHRDAGLIDSGKLSRGTAEQMYLAMRFALTSTMDSKTTVPILFDDIFVNFDEERMIAALSILQEISASRQIMMMTCHRYVLEHIHRILPAAQIISLSSST